MPDRCIQTVTIVGLGLIGGSFGLALRKAGFDGKIVGVCDPPYMEKALQVGAVTHVSHNLQEAVEQADLIYLAHKVDYIIDLLGTIGSIARRGCLITDSGSTKAAITAKAAESIKFAEFVGGHPMAGKEKRGIENADADLFCNRPYVLMNSPSTAPVLDEFKLWLTRIGAHLVMMLPAQHDSIVAFTSHLPQLLSTALASTLQIHHQEAFRKVYGPGLLDMTRLSLSTADLWMSILETNKEEVLKAIDAFSQTLEGIRVGLLHNQLDEAFKSASEYAQQLRR